MFKLYGYENGKIKCIGSSFNEGSIIRMIQNRLNPDYVHFIILKQLEEMTIPYRAILSEEEFIEYADEYSQRINDTTCVELRKEILKRKFKK